MHNFLHDLCSLATIPLHSPSSHNHVTIFVQTQQEQPNYPNSRSEGSKILATEHIPPTYFQ